MFSAKYNDIQDFYTKNKTYEDIENNLLPQIKEQLLFDGLKDLNIPLRDKCTNYLKSNGHILSITKNMDDAQLFYLLVIQFCMQVVRIIMIMDVYHMIPFIRNDVIFQYFTIFFQSNLSSKFTKQKYLNTYIPYFVQLVFDFSYKEYNFVKTHMGNGKMIEAIINEFKEENYPLPAEIVKCVENYMSSIT